VQVAAGCERSNLGSQVNCFPLSQPFKPKGSELKMPLNRKSLLMVKGPYKIPPYTNLFRSAAFETEKNTFLNKLSE
jgi:hypothetical protein